MSSRSHDTSDSSDPDNSASALAHLSDDELQARTRDLLRAAEAISLELTLQSERMATAIEMFNRDVVQPLRQFKGVTPGE